MGGISKLQMMIEHACDTSLREPDLALNLDIVNLINEHGLHYPRDAAMAIVKNLNGGSNSSAMNALTLLDICVKNCGYPFHLVIASKEFLNQLVRRFPERPYQRISTVQYKILEMIQEWNSTICENSRYKNDLKHIQDMYQLLSYKGYWFPTPSEQSKAVLTATEQMLKSEKELEDEDRKAQEAKLQQLLQLGTPAALAEANDLMKAMIGFDNPKPKDYKQEFIDELDKITSKTQELQDKLVSKTSRDRYTRDPLLEELYGQAKSAQQKIQRMATEEQAEGKIIKILELNDFLNSVVENYDQFKNGGDVNVNVKLNGATENNINVSPNKASPPKEAPPPVSLIDFDGPSTSNKQNSSRNYNIGGGSLLDDIADLNFTSIALPVGGIPSIQPIVPETKLNGSQPVSPTNTTGGGSILDDLLDINKNLSNQRKPVSQIQPLMSSAIMGSFPKQEQYLPPLMATPGFSGLMMPSIANPITSAIKPTNNGVSSIFAAPPISQPKKDALADIFSEFSLSSSKASEPKPDHSDLSSNAMSTATVSAKPQYQTYPLSQPLVPMMNSTTLLQQPQPTQKQTAGPMITSNTVTTSTTKEVKFFNKNGLQIVSLFDLQQAGTSVVCKNKFINTTPVPFTNLVFQVAVPKSMTLKLDGASSTAIAPLNTAQVYQTMLIQNPNKDQIKLRFKISYVVNGASVEETGEFIDTN